MLHGFGSLDDHNQRERETQGQLYEGPWQLGLLPGHEAVEHEE